MKKDVIKRKISWEEVKPDASLKEKDGWVNMILRWIVTKDTGSKHVTFGSTIFPPGASHELHTHPNAEEVLYVLEGKGIAISGKEKFEINPGDTVFIPTGDPHNLKNPSNNKPLTIIFVYAGAPSLSDAGYKPIKKDQNTSNLNANRTY